jgi:predicted porin
MKINKTKVLIGVAVVLLIAVALALFSPAPKAKADGIKITGSIEQTYKSVKDGTDGLGQETNVKFAGSKDLGEGLTASGHIRLEDSAIDSSSIKLSKGGFAVEAGADTGVNIHDNINPTVDDNGWDVAPSGVKASNQFTPFQAHDVQHVGLSYTVNKLGTFAINYAPSNNPISAGDGSVADNGGSATEYLFTGGLGIDGAKFLIGREIVKSDTSSNGDSTETAVGASYNFGKLAVGATHRKFDDGSISSTAVDKSLAYSVAYAVTDNLSVGVERIDTDLETAGTVTEEITTATVGYTFAQGFGVALSYADVANKAGVSGTDQESFQIRTVFAF